MAMPPGGQECIVLYSHTFDIVNCKWSTGQSVPRARVNHHRLDNLGATMHAVKGKGLKSTWPHHEES